VAVKTTPGKAAARPQLLDEKGYLGEGARDRGPLPPSPPSPDPINGIWLAKPAKSAKLIPPNPGREGFSTACQLPELVDGRVKEVTGDKAYDSHANHAHLAGLGVASGISRHRPRPGRPRLSRRNLL